MAKILMMTGAIVIVLGLLGFLVLLVKGRTTGGRLRKRNLWSLPFLQHRF